MEDSDDEKYFNETGEIDLMDIEKEESQNNFSLPNKLSKLFQENFTKNDNEIFEEEESKTAVPTIASLIEKQEKKLENELKKEQQIKKKLLRNPSALNSFFRTYLMLQIVKFSQFTQQLYNQTFYSLILSKLSPKSFEIWKEILKSSKPTFEKLESVKREILEANFFFNKFNTESVLKNFQKGNHFTNDQLYKIFLTLLLKCSIRFRIVFPIDFGMLEVNSSNKG